MLERVGERCFNTAILAGPHGIEAIYRKTHTLCLGVDRFTTPGDIPYRVYDLPIGRLGILICYDLRFPEPARILALQGVQMIALPTNWPESSTIQPDVFTRSRAAENHVFVLAADRVGEERGARFLGRSQIVGPNGAVLSEASRDSQEALLYDIEPSAADGKNVVVRAGFHEMDCMADRRPDLYAQIAADRQLMEVR
jgi:predicted amidohydrolase